MDIDVTFTPADLAQQDRTGRIVVVLDVVRASTTIIQALAHGCARVLPQATVEEARSLAATLPPRERLLGGERNGQRISGFDLGNSPREYTAERVRDKTLVFTTTNGTRTLQAAQGADSILVGAFANLPAVVQKLAAAGRPVLLAAAGRLDRPVLDDVVCAGMFVQQLQERQPEGGSLSDAALLAWQVYRAYEGRLVEALRLSASGQALLRLGREYEDDLRCCAQVGVSSLIPAVNDGALLPLPPGSVPD
ncbi:MAG: 2-phosphosulfolactate phosphatase [Chloroflexi bacterium]|nr:2-phosphosulfolactate phosphatase [Chloroflexota bacterium]